MLPLSLLRSAQGHPMLVELKNGETYNGNLQNIDNWMNLMLRDVVCTSKDGDRFWKMTEVYIRGNTVKYLRVPDEIIDVVRDDRREHFGRGGGRGMGRGGGQRGIGRGGARGGRGRRGGGGGGRGTRSVAERSD